MKKKRYRIVNRHGFQRTRNARRLARVIAMHENELLGSRQSWEEWRFLERMSKAMLDIAHNRRRY